MRAVVLLGVLGIGLASAEAVAAQDLSLITVVGQVLTEETNAPVANAEVWIDGTQHGAQTDASGAFSIDEVPARHSTFAVYVPGEEAVTIIDIDLDEPSRQEVELLVPFNEAAGAEGPTPEALQQEIARLQQEIRRLQTELYELSPSEEVDKDHLELIEKYFIGASSKRSPFKNPEALRFSEERQGTSRVLKVTATQPLEIENRVLGYTVRIWLDELRLLKYGWQYDMRYNAVITFRELAPRDRKEARRWAKNRQRAYEGSFTHFLRSLAARELEEEGFVVAVPHDQSRASAAVGIPGVGLEGGGPTYVKLYDPYVIVSNAHSRREQELRFPNVIQVTFAGKRVDNSLEIYSSISGEHPQSTLSLTADQARFDTSGHLIDRKLVATGGYWSIRRIVDLLPSGYMPE